MAGVALALHIFFMPTGTLARKRSRMERSIRLGKTFTMPGIGLKGKLIKNAKAAPIGSLEAQILTQTYSDGTVKKITAYFPRDIWLRSQLAGTWRHPLCVLSIYRMTLPAPSELKTLCTLSGRSYVLKKVYDEWERKAAQLEPDWSDAKIIEWLHYLSNKKFKASPEKVSRSVRNAVTKRFIPENNDNDFFYVVVSRTSPNAPYLFRYEFRFGPPDKKSAKVMLQSLASMSFYPPKKIKESAKRKKIILKHHGKGGGKHSEKYLASRKAVIDSIKNMRNWWYVETENFIMVANIKSQATAKALAQNLERSRNLYTKIFPLEKPMDAVSVARMFATREEYLNYVGPELRWTGGVWMSMRKELVVSPMSWGSKREIRKMMAQITLHEAFHQYIYFATGEKQTAAWFNEGMAQFFEHAVFKSNKIHIGLSRRQAGLMPQLAAKQNIDDILKMSYSQFYDLRKSEHYALAWGMLYFMLKGAPVMKDCAEFAEIPRRYYDAMVETGDAVKATKAAWNDCDTYKFSEKLKAFWSSRRLMKRAAKFDPLKKKK
jgi:hypothetical protein